MSQRSVRSDKPPSDNPGAFCLLTKPRNQDHRTIRLARPLFKIRKENDDS